jgi:hypothetical protein
MYKPSTYSEVTYFLTYLPMYETHFISYEMGYQGETEY